jgi:hypothetical protein
MDEAGKLGMINQMWLNKGGVASVVPLKTLEKIWPILYHSLRGMNAVHFIIHTKEGDIMVQNNKCGMPYLNLKEVEAEVVLCLVQDTIDTVCSNMAIFTKREGKEAKAAHEAQGMLGHPTDCNFLRMVHSNMILNCVMTANAIKMLT